MKLFFDTETTGMVMWKSPHNHPSQPQPIQLACVLRADCGTTVASLQTVIKTHGKEIHPKAEATHGISKEMADSCGVSRTSAVDMFLDMLDVADSVVAHNAAFDVKIMRAAAFSVGIEGDIFAETNIVCTKDLSTPVLCIPNKHVKGTFKWPSLEECMQYFYQESIEGAHDAMVDVEALIRVYDALDKVGAAE